jgi:hypothetical protein
VAESPFQSLWVFNGSGTKQCGRSFFRSNQTILNLIEALLFYPV